MPILGITGLNGTYHDSSACLILDNGEWIAAEEERFNRIKHSSGFPALSIEWCLKEAGISKTDIDCVGYFLDTSIHYHRYFLKTVFDNPDKTDDFFCYSYKLFNYWHNQLYNDICQWLSIPKEKFIPVRHHLAHAASTYYISPFDEAAILTVDGAGDADSSGYFLGQSNQVKMIASPMLYPTSIGMLYNFIAAHLGLGNVGSSGKLMGLAPYGEPKYIDYLKKIVLIPTQVDSNSVIKFNFNYFGYHLGGNNPIFSEIFYEIFGSSRQSNEPILQKHADIAASMQLMLEEVVLFLAKQLKLISGMKNLCYAGGVALNIDANTRIKNESGFDEVFIMPSAYDAGTSIGSALYLHHTHLKRTRVAPLVHPFKGPKYNGDQIKESLVRSGLKFKEIEDPVNVAASLLAEGLIIAWFQGREEIGPRALGNRSILMDPGISNGKDIINQKVKYRESFRPFAPSVPLDDADKYFVCPFPSPFMLYSFRVKDEWQTLLPAITHVDNSARVHTVTAEENLLFYRLLKEFGNYKGYSVLLNTSFNVQGQPLVSTPEQAILTYLHSNLDALVMGSFVVIRNESPSNGRKCQLTSLDEGIIDSGKKVKFEPFEFVPRPASYPQGIELKNFEKQVLDKYLYEARKISTSKNDSPLKDLAKLIKKIEQSIDLQAQLGSNSLVILWKTLAELWLQSSDLDLDSQLDPVYDNFLYKKTSFPGEQDDKNV